MAKAKNQAGHRAPAYQPIEADFVLDHPERVKGRDGKTYILFHRLSHSKGASTKRDIMKSLGFHSELLACERDASRRYKSAKEVRLIVSSREVKLKATCDSRIRACKSALSKQYSEQHGATPLFSFVRISSKDDEKKLFFQGLVNSDGEFVVGNRDDAALWAIENMQNTRGMARTYKLAMGVGKDLVNRGLSASVRQRLSESLKS